MEKSEDVRYVARNRKARHDYEVHSTIEAGIELKGSEVKSLRDGKVILSDCYASIDNSQLILKNLHISPYKMGQELLDPIRPRRLLVHKRELRKLQVQTAEKGLTLIPLAIYFKGKVAKIELAVASGRKKYDKRAALAEKDAKKRIRRATHKDY